MKRFQVIENALYFYPLYVCTSLVSLESRECTVIALRGSLYTTNIRILGHLISCDFTVPANICSTAKVLHEPTNSM